MDPADNWLCFTARIELNWSTGGILYRSDCPFDMRLGFDSENPGEMNFLEQDGNSGGSG